MRKDAAEVQIGSRICSQARTRRSIRRARRQYNLARRLLSYRWRPPGSLSYFGGAEFAVWLGYARRLREPARWTDEEM